MAGGKARPKKDWGMKVSQGKPVKQAEILCRRYNVYKSGINVRGEGTLFALCSGTIYFTKKKTSHGRVRTFINIKPEAKKSK